VGSNPAVLVLKEFTLIISGVPNFGKNILYAFKLKYDLNSFV
jgi:hypothetical protein